MTTIVSLILLLIIVLPVGYLMLQLAASWLPPSRKLMAGQLPTKRFIIAIPAHDEETVIANTVQRLLNLDYPADLYSIHIVADHCSDRTAELARGAGAVVHERNEGPRSGKGAALSWLFDRVLKERECDAVVIFDADTRVDPSFLHHMNGRLLAGDQIIQGQHVISNPEEGWFPALTWAMFIIDNRFQNLGRANLGWSAKNMGDSICFRADVLRNGGWGEGLADDYQIRQKFLLNNIRISYEPAAKGYGEAPLSWQQARAQRARWIRGVYNANKQSARQLLEKGIKTRNTAMLDGALQAYLPSYSTLTAATFGLLFLQLAGNLFLGLGIPGWLLAAWIVLLVFLFVYPLAGLAMEKAPLRAYAAILLGTFFIVWRIWLALTERLGNGNTIWVRTVHRG